MSSLKRPVIGLAAIAGLGVVSVGVRRVASTPGLPVLCRLRGHGWMLSGASHVPARHTCARCESIDIPAP